MRKTAGFLKFCATFALVFEVVGLAILVLIEAALALTGKFSELAEKSGAITISGGTMTPEEMDALKPVVLAVIAFGIIALLLAMLGTLKTRQALEEVKSERPFSDKSIDSVKAAARFEVIGGIVGILGGIVLSAMASQLRVNGTPVGQSSVTLHLSFIILAAEKYMFYHVAKYGQSLEMK
ncbi:MAG: hypothetical protein IKE21_04765 [Erysipelotrichaceae bacterium]|nr:hypothetical protein [Erysipelotrichaceae bacterium]